MRVVLTMRLGSDPAHIAQKTIDLSFAPTPGMVYHDGTWKHGGQKVESVTIVCSPDEEPFLEVGLSPDEEKWEGIVETYKSWGWEII